MAIAAPFPAARATSRTTSRTGSRTAPRRPVRRTQDGLRLTRRGRIVIAAVSALFLLLVVLFSGALSADAGTSLADQGRATGVVVVQQGESLWQIAKAVAPGVDPRETVIAIRELNALGDDTVVPGQSIVVPASGVPGA